MADSDHDEQDRPGAFSATPSPVPPERPKTGGADHAAAQTAETEGLASHFVRRTDNDYHGIEDPSLIGEDIGDDLVDENGDPIED